MTSPRGPSRCSRRERQRFCWRISGWGKGPVRPWRFQVNLWEGLIVSWWMFCFVSKRENDVM